MSFFNWYLKQRKETKALKKIVQVMQAEEGMLFNALCREVEQKLREMSPEQALKILQEWQK